MPEDWNSIAAEVDEAIRSVADISQADGYPATIRRTATTANPYDPADGVTTVTYTTVYVVETANKERDRNGTLVGTVRRSLLVGANSGFVPNKADKVKPGQSLTYVDAETDASIDWEEIDEVLPLSPAGVAVMYEIMLAN